MQSLCFWRKSLQTEQESMENEYNEMRKKVLAEAETAKKKTEALNKVFIQLSYDIKDNIFGIYTCCK